MLENTYDMTEADKENKNPNCKCGVPTIFKDFTDKKNIHRQIYVCEERDASDWRLPANERPGCNTYITQASLDNPGASKRPYRRNFNNGQQLICTTSDGNDMNTNRTIVNIISMCSQLSKDLFELKDRVRALENIEEKEPPTKKAKVNK